MSMKFVYPIFLLILIVGVSSVSINVQKVEAPYPIIYIRANGLIDPSTANITSSDNVTYTFVADINASIVVERSNIVIDGDGHTLQGYDGGNGISLSSISNATIKDLNIRNFSIGISLNNSSRNSICGNNIANNTEGISLNNSSNTVISENNLTNSFLHGIGLEFSDDNNLVQNHIIHTYYWGIEMHYSDSNTIAGNNLVDTVNGSAILVGDSRINKIYHNNFINNNISQAFVYGSYRTAWDDNYPSGGNYWSDYSGIDFFSGLYQNETDSDGIGDTPHPVSFDNEDNYPLMGMFSSFNTSLGYPVNVVCNSSVEDFEYFESNSTIRMHLSNMTATQTLGFCRVTIPKNLVSPPYTVIIDDGLTEVLYFNYAIYDNGTHRWIYFAYEHSTHEVVIQSDTTPPAISIIYPENKTYAIRDVPLTFIVSESTSWIGYRLDEQMNVTINSNTTIVGLSDATHFITVYANDTAGNMGYSDIVYFTVDTASPSIEILSPENRTYDTTDIPLNFTVNESVSWTAYSLNGQANITITGNTTLSGLSDGSHILIVYANDIAGNTGASEIIYFSIDTTQPFPIEIAAVIMTIALVGVAVFVYFMKFKK